MADTYTPSKYVKGEDYIKAVDTYQKVERKYLVTVAAWGDKTGSIEEYREILGVRTDDSSIELNADTETLTDILGITYTDVNKTEPQQDLDPFQITGGSALGKYLSNALLTNDINAYNACFTVYIVAIYDNKDITSTTPQTNATAIRHEHCTILPTAIGGDLSVNMPIEVHFSNDITKGKVTLSNGKLEPTFTFTADTSISLASDQSNPDVNG